MRKYNNFLNRYVSCKEHDRCHRSIVPRRVYDPAQPGLCTEGDCDLAMNATADLIFAPGQSFEVYAPPLIPILSAEHNRIASLQAHTILDSKPDEFFTAQHWAPEPFGPDTNRSITRTLASCSYTISGSGSLTPVPDARQHLARSSTDTNVRQFDAHDAGRPRHPADAASSRSKTYDPAARSSDRDEYYRVALDLNPQIPWTAHPDGMIDEASPRWLELTGMEHEATRGLGWTAAIYPDDVPTVLQDWKTSIASGMPLHGEYRVRSRHGNYRWFRIRAAARQDAAGNIIRWYGTLDDIHDDKLTTTALLESEHRLRYALEVGGLGAWEYDVASQCITASDLCAKAFGLSSGNDLSSYDVVIAAIHPEDRRLLHAEREKVLAGNYQMDFEIRSLWPDGTIHWVRLTGAASPSVDGSTDKAFGLALDVTERKAAAEERERAQQRLVHLANHDELTGVGNRRLLDANLEKALAETATNARTALLCIDLDEFKSLNDRLGHEAGDALLRQVANRLSNQLPAGATIARTGGDEFAVLLFPARHQAVAEAIARSLLKSLADPVELEGRPVTIGASIGIAMTGDCPMQPDQLRRNAETALYRAKTSGRNTYRLFQPEMDARLQAREALKASFHDALAQDQLTLSYQPIVELSSGMAVCFEALMRWKHPQRGWITPDEFIPLAEETGWVTRLGRWALLQACTQAAGWPRNIRVSVNLSAVQFASGDLVKDVQAALDVSGLAADRLELEVTETLLLHDSSVNLSTLDGLRRLGARIVMDDFGTGYSSLAYLRKFRFDKIKVDKSLITGLPDSEGGDTIVEAILGLGRSLGITVTAEGIESAEQLQFLLRNECAQGQGYLFSQPMSAENLPDSFPRKWFDPGPETVFP